MSLVLGVLASICFLYVGVAEASDLDVFRFSATKRVSLTRGRDVVIKLSVKNPGGISGPSLAIVTGTQDSFEVYYETLMVNDETGRGSTKFVFPRYRPDAPGAITWRVEIRDVDPDIDVGTAITNVVL
jgi:hypothetical protein